MDAVQRSLGYEDYSENVRQVIAMAAYEADMSQSSTVAADHLLMAMIRRGPTAFEQFIDAPPLEEWRRTLEARLAAAAHTSLSPLAPGETRPLGDSAKLVLRKAAGIATLRGNKALEEQHVLYAIVVTGGTTASKLLTEGGLTRELMETRLR